MSVSLESGRNLLSNLHQWSRDNLALALLFLTAFLFISKSLYNVPVAIMALIGFYRCIISPKAVWADLHTRFFIVLFLLLWLPLLISLVDAVNPSRSAKTVFPYLRFLFMGIYILQEARRIDLWEKLRLAVFCLLAFWCVDAVIQYIFKADLFGYPYEAGHITGMFYPRNTISHVTAALSPLYFEFIREKGRKIKWLWLLLIPLFMVILLSGRRSAWIMLLVSMAGYLFYLFRRELVDRGMKKLLLLSGIMLVITVCITVAVNQPLQNRIQETMQLFSGDYEQIDVATARRLPIWEAALSMIRSNWLNGIGPRGYRYAYSDYTDEDDYWVKLSMSPTHPHQMYLEILVETGIIGLIGFLAAAYLFTSLLMKEDLIMYVLPALLCLITAIFPLNTHLAFYGSYWSSFFWWLLLIIFIQASTIQLTGHHKEV